MEIKGTQVDFQVSLLVIDLVTCIIMKLKVNLFGSDVSGSEVFNGTCNPNPCENGGNCQIGLGNGFSCLCPDGYIGKIMFLIIYLKLIFLKLKEKSAKKM